MRLRENQRRAKNAKIWIIISISVSILTIPYVFYLGEITKGINEYTVTRDDVIVFGLISLAFGAIALGAFIGSAITFIQWFRRAYFNAHIVFKGLRYSEGWAAGSWFIPIFWWIGPIQIATDFYKKTEAKLREEGVLTGKSQYHILVWWWVFYVASAIFNQVDQEKFGVTLDIEMTFGIMGAIASVISGFFVLMFINNYSQMERELMNLEVNESSLSVSDNPDLLD